MTRLLVDRVAIIGLGLIGGSLAAALRDGKVCREVIGYDLNAGEMATGLRRELVDRTADSVATAVSDADLVVLAVPVRAYEGVLISLKDHLPGDAVITDVGSVKACLLTALDQVFGPGVRSRVVPGHPIAGSERSGAEAADARLFCDHKVILTPLADTDVSAIKLVTSLWQRVGAEVMRMPVAHHDQVLAATSHLPHILAFSLVDTLAGEPDNREIFRYAAGGFRDFTRIAASDPTMWLDISLANQKAILQSIDHFTDGLEQLRQALKQQDEQTLLGIFSRAKSARLHFSKMLTGKAYTETMSAKEICYLARQGKSITGSIRVPGDKSISHRAIILGSIASGITEVKGFLEGEDSLATLQAFRDMGVVIEGPHSGEVRIYGVGLNGLRQPPGPLYLGNSGTSMRLLSGLLGGQAFASVLEGDKSLSGRPMGRVATPLAEMGVQMETTPSGTAPLRIQPSAGLRGIRYAMPVASAQVKSSLLLAGLYAEGETRVTEPAPTRDHTERMLKGFGYPVTQQGATVSLRGGGQLTGTTIDVPADISSAAFFMVAASIVPGSDLLLEHVGVNPTRIGVINILRLMGADITLENPGSAGGEPVADIRIRYRPLKGIEIPLKDVPLAIDEFPVLFIAAVCAEGETILRGAEELRVKESDRIQAMADGLAALGVSTKVQPDGIVITGSDMGGGTVNSQGDHRIAMAFVVAALRARGDVRILDCANVATSFPGFTELANAVGFNVAVEECSND